MLKIYLVRHGQDEDNSNGILNGRRDKPLTSLGKNQAEELAQKIIKANLTFDKVYTSPLKRTLQTAEILTDSLKLTKPIVLPELIERDFGEMTGRKIDQIPDLCAPHILKTQTATYFLKAKDAETFPKLLIRAKKLLNHITSNHPTGNILLVTHGDMGKMLYASYHNLFWKDVLTQFHFGNSELILLSKSISLKRTFVFNTKQYNL